MSRFFSDLFPIYILKSRYFLVEDGKIYDLFLPVYCLRISQQSTDFIVFITSFLVFI